MRTKRESGKIIMWLRKIMGEGSVNGNENKEDSNQCCHNHGNDGKN
jgi:hypothetical protein